MHQIESLSSGAQLWAIRHTHKWRLAIRQALSSVTWLQYKNRHEAEIAPLLVLILHKQENGDFHNFISEIVISYRYKGISGWIVEIRQLFMNHLYLCATYKYSKARYEK